MKIIFLDIDGVLCTFRSHEAFNGRGLMQHLDPVGCRMVDRLCRETGAQIVISSTWRKHHDRQSMIAILQNAGFERPDFHEDWMTPSGGWRRGDEIKKWLDDHPGVERYVILDDDDDMLPEQLLSFVRTAAQDGFLTNHYIEAKALLTGAKSIVTGGDEKQQPGKGNEGVEGL